MTATFPKPGRGYLIREYLGGGAMKEAYRATSPVGFRDVAILRYIQRSDEAEMEKDFNVLRRLRNTEFSEYLGYPEMFFAGDDGAMYFAEELLARPLDSLSPMRNGSTLLRIARDLSRGLQCLHREDLKHSDLKLDNCGLDNQGRAKIFDLSSVASEPGDNIRGAILTRAPEYFDTAAKYDLPGDVWALGATLFALRTGGYPFVSRDEINQRVEWGKQARSSDKTERENAERRKAEFDEGVKDRVVAIGAESKLHERARNTLPGSSGDLLCRMLAFAPAVRPTAEMCAIEWSKMLRDETATTADIPHDMDGYVKRLAAYLDKVMKDYITVTDQQWDRLITNYEKLKAELPDASGLGPIEEQIAQVQRRRIVSPSDAP